MDNRGVSPVVEKTVAIGLVALFVAGGIGTLLGGVVPDYRRGVGQEVGERVLAEAATEIERAVPASERDVAVRRERVLPGTIDGHGYTLEVSNRTLHLRHPDSTIGGTAALTLPPSVTVRDGTWRSGDLVVRVHGPAANRTLSIGGTSP